MKVSSLFSNRFSKQRVVAQPAILKILERARNTPPALYIVTAITNDN